MQIRIGGSATLTHSPCRPNSLATVPLMLGVLALTASAYAENVVYPADAGVLNVKTEYGAHGDGVHDDTAYIQKALADGLNKHKIVYLPNGFYLVSDTLKWNDGTAKNGGWGRFLSMQGQSRAGTVIILKNSCAGFTDGAVPQPVVMTASGDDAGNYSDANGEGNQAFEDSICNLTINTGSGNPGAVGVDYQVSNWGSLRDVTIRSSDPAHAGSAGISLLRRDNGPGLIKNIAIDGFRNGIVAGQEICHLTMEHIRLSHQSIAGIDDQDAILAIRGLRSDNACPAVRVERNGALSLMDADLRGGSSMASAVELIDPDSRAHLRGVISQGYGSSVQKGEKQLQGKVSEWTSDPILSMEKIAPAPLSLPVRETPTFFDDNLSHWASVGSPSGEDDAAKIQAAMNSGKDTVHFPSGHYKLEKSIIVPASVKLVIGMGCEITANLNGQPLFQVEGGGPGDCTIFDRLTAGGNGILVEGASPRTVVLRNIGTFGGEIYRSAPGAGPVFIEDVAGSGYRFSTHQQVWARQWNAEGSANPKVVNDGAKVWAFGLKTEGNDVVIETKNGGQTELWGAFLYSFGDGGNPAFISNDGTMSLGFTGVTYVPNGFYSKLVEETTVGVTADFKKERAYGRGGGVTVPLYTDGKTTPKRH